MPSLAESLPPPLNHYPYISLIILTPTTLITLILLWTRVTSTVRYHLALRKFTSTSDSRPASPPVIPYTIPVLGHAHKGALLNARIGAFWNQLFGSFGHPRSSGACTLLMGGQSMHILFSAPAIEAMFKIKKPNRLGFALQIVENVLGVNKTQFERHLGFDDPPDPRMGGLRSFERLEEITHNCLLKKEAVADHVSSFINAVFGTKLLEVYPELENDFFDFDQNMQALFFGTPKVFNSKNMRSERSVLRGRVLDEVRIAQKPDGSVDVATLVTLPLLQSIYEEVLRLYLDALVTRNLQEDVILPLDTKGVRNVLLKKGETVMAPSWLAHRDQDNWNDPPAGRFFAERFLKEDPETGKTIFSTIGSAGKLFPYGGGKTMCPGRVFAKQEMLGSVALVLAKFKVEYQGFVDDKGKDTAAFPSIRDALIGSVMLSSEGDMKVDISN